MPSLRIWHSNFVYYDFRFLMYLSIGTELLHWFVLNIHHISCGCVMIVMPGCAWWSHVAPLMPGRKILLDCETGPRDRGETWVPMTRGQTQHHTPHYQPSGSHGQPLVMARHYGGWCEDFIMAEDINDKREGERQPAWRGVDSGDWPLVSTNQSPGPDG